MNRVLCPNCKQAMQYAPSSAGQAVRCPHCKQGMRLPAAPASPPPAAVQPPPPPPPPPPQLPAARPSQQAPSELGELVREFVPRNWWPYVTASAALFVLDVPLLYFAFGADTKWAIAPAMILAAAAILGVLIFGMLAVVAYKRRAELREGGLVSHSCFGTEKFLWGQVRWVYVMRSGMPESTELRFDLEGGKSVWVNWLLLDLEDLVVHVDNLTTPLIQARVEEELDRGMEVPFGEYLSVAATGLRYWPHGQSGQEYRLDWAEVKSFVVGRYQRAPGAGGLEGAATDVQVRILGTDGSRWAVAVANVPNFPVLLHLLEHRYGVNVDML